MRNQLSQILVPMYSSCLRFCVIDWLIHFHSCISLVIKSWVEKPERVRSTYAKKVSAYLYFVSKKPKMKYMLDIYLT